MLKFIKELKVLDYNININRITCFNFYIYIYELFL